MKKSIHGSCTVDEDGYCDECGETWPQSAVYDQTDVCNITPPEDASEVQRYDGRDSG